RLDRLRDKELAGTLAGPEHAELAALIAQVETEEAQALGPAMDRLRTEVVELDNALSAVQDKNEELARLLSQQQNLAEDARRFLVEFEQRRASILEALARVTAGPLPAA